MGRALAPRARSDAVPVAGLAAPLVAGDRRRRAPGAWPRRQGGRWSACCRCICSDEGGGKLLPLGIAISDYLDGLFEEGCGLEIAEAMLRRLTERQDWRRCELHPLRQGSPLLEASAPPGCADEVLEFEPVPRR